MPLRKQIPLEDVYFLINLSVIYYLQVTINKRNMNRHVEVHHPTLIEGLIYICPTCPKVRVLIL